MITTLKSCSVKLPLHILKSVHFNDNDTLNVKVQNNTIILEKVDNSYKNIKELFSDYNGGYEAKEIDWGKKRGTEIW